MSIDPIYLALVLVSVILSMTLHEAMHAFMGYWLGDDTAKVHGRLTFNPLKHIDPLTTVILPILLAAAGAPPFGAAKPVPFNPSRVRYGEFGAALVGVAGPLTNLILGFIGFCIVILGGLTLDLSSHNVFELFLDSFIMVNLSFFVFNMLPIPPLDGSRVLYAVAPLPVQRIMENMERYGLFIVFGIVLLFNAQLAQFMQAAILALLRVFSLPFGVQLGV